jgi:2-hydroxychromene-2-carboxylate isomerase
MKSVEIYFDLSSPYSYLASTQIDAVAARHGATVVWKPMVLHAVFKATGNTMPASIAAKATYMFADLQRWSKQYDVPFKFTSRFPVNAIKAMRLCIAGEPDGKAGAVAKAAFRALWVDDRDLNAEAELRAIAGEAGIDPDKAVAAIESPEVKERLRTYTDEAAKRGVFGAPAIFVGDQLFWGNDRLHHVEDALRK